MIRAFVPPLVWLPLFAALLAVPAAVLAQGRGSGAVLGRVTDAGTGRPIRGATITIGSPEAPDGTQALSASDGIFFLAPVLPGRHTVTATYGGYEPASLSDYGVRSGDPSGPALLSLRRVGQPGRRGDGGERGSATGPSDRAHGRRGDGETVREDLHLEARVRWETTGDVAPPGELAPRPAVGADRFVVVEIHRFPEARPRQRTPVLSEEQILIVGTDARGRPRDWSLAPDPGILRVEGAGPDGALTGETHRLAGTEFLVTMPADPEIAALHVYRPRWSGTLFSLELLGAARFPARPALAGERPGSLTSSPQR